jgi:hypothetical protein
MADALNIIRDDDQIRVKTVTTTRANNNTFSTDPHLFGWLKANAFYMFYMDIVFQSHSNAYIKFTMNGPTGATIRWAHMDNTSGVSGWWEDDVMVIPTTVSASSYLISFAGVAFTDTTAGAFNFQWAQNSSYSTGAIIYKGSTLRLMRVR